MTIEHSKDAGTKPMREIRLTSRELRVLKLLARGKPRKKAAEILGIAPRTLDSVLEDAYRTLNTDSLTGAFVALGWLRPGGVA